MRPCPKLGSEINDFDLKQGQGFKASAAHVYANFSPIGGWVGGFGGRD